MKKLLNLVVLLMLMASCASQNEPQHKSRAEQTGNIEKFNMYGEMHNAMLMAIDDNQELDTRLGKCATLDETLDALVDIQKRDIDNLPMASVYKSELIFNLNRHFKND